MSTQTKKDWTLIEIIDWSSNFFKNKNIENFRLDAEVLLAHTLQIKRFDLYLNFDRILTKNELENFKQLILRRAEHVPVAYITEQKEFMGLKFKVNENVLIPRPETEFLVEEVLKQVETLQCNVSTIVDTFTGSGNIPISIAKQLPKNSPVFLYGIDVDLKALHCANENNLLHKTQNKVRFLHGNILNPLDILGLKNKVDIITANPPYIKTKDLDGLSREVKCEPKLALDGGSDGLYFYKRLIDESLEYLKIDGYIFLEIDALLDEPISANLKNKGFDDIKITKDLQKIERVLSARRVK